MTAGFVVQVAAAVVYLLGCIALARWVADVLVRLATAVHQRSVKDRLWDAYRRRNGRRWARRHLRGPA